LTTNRTKNRIGGLSQSFAAPGRKKDISNSLEQSSRASRTTNEQEDETPKTHSDIPASILTNAVAISNKPQSVSAAQQGGLSEDNAVQTLFGANAGGDGNALSNLYSIDPATGTATLIGPIGFRAVSGMAFNRFTGVLYATGRRLSSGTLVLLTINTATGVGTEVGPLGGWLQCSGHLVQKFGRDVVCLPGGKAVHDQYRDRSMCNS